MVSYRPLPVLRRPSSTDALELIRTEPASLEEDGRRPTALAQLRQMNQRRVGPALDIKDQVIPIVRGRLRALHRCRVRVVSC